MIVLLTGPEKVGKTTLAREVVQQSRGLGVNALHANMRRPRSTNQSIYLELLTLGQRDDLLIVMDRCWIDEIVYARVLHRQSLVRNPDATEATFGRLLREGGVGYILAPTCRRGPLDETDIQVDYADERRGFVQYARQWGYPVIEEWSPCELAARIIQKLERRVWVVETVR